jgi:hypothetical protein
MSSPTLWSVRLRRQARRQALDQFDEVDPVHAPSPCLADRFRVSWHANPGGFITRDVRRIHLTGTWVNRPPVSTSEDQGVRPTPWWLCVFCALAEERVS